MIKSNKRILIIQNKTKSLKFLDNCLKTDYSVSIAQDINEGISLAGKGRFDIIFAAQAPLVKKISKLGLKSRVIAISSNSSSSNIEKAIKAGADDVISRPLNKEAVLSAVEKALLLNKLITSQKRSTDKLQKQNKDLEKKLRERTKELVLIYKIGQEISSTLELNKVLQSIVDKLSMILGVKICAILLVNSSGKLLIKSFQGLDPYYVSQTSIKMGESISGWVWEHKEAVFAKDIDTDPRFKSRKKERYYAGSLMSVPLIAKNKVIGIININNKKSGELFSDYDLRLIKEIAAEAAIAIENANLFKSLQDVYMRTVATLTSVIDAKDHYTRSHSDNVTRYAIAVAKEMDIPADKISSLKQACQLHDLGKIGIHDHILTKPGKLTPKEWEEMKLHSLRGAEILAPLNFMNGISGLVEQHHERYDGKGYPNRYKGDAIELGARIMAVADAFDAMISDRPYRKGYTIEEAVKEIKKCSGTQFDPKVVDVFLKVIEKNPNIIT